MAKKNKKQNPPQTDLEPPIVLRNLTEGKTYKVIFPNKDIMVGKLYRIFKNSASGLDPDFLFEVKSGNKELMESLIDGKYFALPDFLVERSFFELQE